MGFDTASFLKSLFSGADLADCPQAVPMPTAGGAGAIDAGGEAGKAGLIPDAADVLLEWIEPDEDVALTACGEVWRFGALGKPPREWRCQHCDAAALNRSRRWPTRRRGCGENRHGNGRRRHRRGCSAVRR